LSNEDRIDVAGGKATILVSEHVDSLESKNVSPPPSGTVTFLFSDMFGSTDLVRELGDIKSREISRMHEDILSDTIRKHEGYIVKEMGDGFMAAFASSRSAVLCAIAIQNNLFKLREREKELPINVRIGLNTGEAILENGDYFGRAVNEAARVSAKALADQILITAVTKRMADSAGDIEFGDALEFELKGLPGIHTMYEVQWN
jgi:class 3 adenylate cyclase